MSVSIATRERTFAEVFRDAIDNSGKTLSQICDELESGGANISQASLSYWQSGRSVPRRQSSVKTLTKLEQILYLPKGTLIAAATDANHRSFGENAFEVEETFETTSRGMIMYNDEMLLPSEADLHDIDWHNAVQRKAMRANIKVRDGGREMVVETNCIVGLNGLESPVFYIGNVWGEGESHPEITDVIGGRLGAKFTYNNERYVLREINLPAGRYAGELRQVAWTLRRRSEERFTRTPQRWFALPLSAYAVSIDFGSDVPHYVEWVKSETVEWNGLKERTETSRQMACTGGIARLTLEDVRDCSAYIRWVW